MRQARISGDDLWLPPCSRTFEEKNQEWKLSDFQMTAKLGQGAYGKVVKVKAKDSSEEYAMKIVPKQLIKNQQMEDQVKNEIHIMTLLNHENIINLLTYFEDHRNIYFILELAEDKHLYHKLRSQGKFEEKEAATIIHDLLKAVDYLHTRDPPIIHRDIKAENVLFIDSKAKLADFGWSNLKDRVRTTYCGTPDYLAPEMVLQKGHNEKVDVWTVGILAFELLNGKAPYTPPPGIDKDQANSMLEKNILKKDAVFVNEKCSSLAKDLVKKMLIKDYNERPAASTQVIHEWFKQLLPDRFVGASQLSAEALQNKSLVTLKNNSYMRLFSKETNENFNSIGGSDGQSNGSCLQGPIVKRPTSNKLGPKILSDSIDDMDEFMSNNVPKHNQKTQDNLMVPSRGKTHIQPSVLSKSVIVDTIVAAEKKEDYSMAAVKKEETGDFKEARLKIKINELKEEINDTKKTINSKDCLIQESNQKLRILASKLLKDENGKDLSSERLQELLEKETQFNQLKEDLKSFEIQKEQCNELLITKDSLTNELKEKDLKLSREKTKVETMENELKSRQKYIQEQKTEIESNTDDWMKDSLGYEARIKELEKLLANSGNNFFGGDNTVAVLGDAAELVKKKVATMESQMNDYLSTETTMDELNSLLDNVNFFGCLKKRLSKS